MIINSNRRLSIYSRNEEALGHSFLKRRAARTSARDFLPQEIAAAEMQQAVLRDHTVALGPLAASRTADYPDSLHSPSFSSSPRFTVRIGWPLFVLSSLANSRARAAFPYLQSQNNYQHKPVHKSTPQRFQCNAMFFDSIFINRARRKAGLADGRDNNPSKHLRNNREKRA